MYCQRKIQLNINKNNAWYCVFENDVCITVKNEACRNYLSTSNEERRMNE